MFAFKWFNNLRFPYKLVVLLLPSFIGFLGLGGWNVYSSKVIDGVKHQVDTAYQVRSETMASALTATHYGAAVESQIPDTISIKHQDLKNTQDRLSGFKEWVSKQDNAPLDKNYTDLLKQVKQILDMPAKSGEGAPEEAALLGDISTTFNKVLQEHLDNLALHYGQIRTNFDLLYLIVIGVGISLLGVVLFITMRVVLNPLNDMGNLAKAIAAGDLTHRLRSLSKDEFGKISTEMNAALENIQGLIREVADGSARLDVSVERLMDAAREANAGVVRQQTETQLVAESVEGMSSAIQEMAHSATHTTKVSQEASVQARSGSSVITDALGSIATLAEGVLSAGAVIQTLKSKSENIDAVLKVICDIAEQTNLLALNAAIEAARAGEQGRGFAVVADEVRKLAERTQQSTVEIRKIVEELQQGAENAVLAMDQGRKQAQSTESHASKADQAMAAISGTITTITMIAEMNAKVADIAAQQINAADKISSSIANISHIAEENASNANGTIEEGTHLASLASQLKHHVSNFKV